MISSPEDLEGFGRNLAKASEGGVAEYSESAKLLAMDQNDSNFTTVEAHVFIDTNVLLHYRALDGISWREFTQTSNVILHIAQPVLDEIAQKKDMGETKVLRKRAGQIVKRFNEILDEGSNRTQLRPGEWLILEDETPIMGEYPGLNAASKDDQLLACLMKFQSGISVEVIVATGDSSLAFRTKVNRWNIKYRKLDESYRLPEEADRDQIERRSLERELFALKNAQPKLKICFEGGESMLRPSVGSDEMSEEVEEFVRKMKDRYAPIRQSGVAGVKLTVDLFRSDGTLSEHEVETYNSQLEPFYDAVREWRMKRAVCIQRSIKISLELENEGNAPAESVLVSLHFPDGFVLVGEDRLYSR